MAPVILYKEILLILLPAIFRGWILPLLKTCVFTAY